MVPDTGIKKLNRAIEPTLLYFKSMVHMEKARAESKPRYNKTSVELIVKFVT